MIYIYIQGRYISKTRGNCQLLFEIHIISDDERKYLLVEKMSSVQQQQKKGEKILLMKDDHDA